MTTILGPAPFSDVHAGNQLYAASNCIKACPALCFTRMQHTINPIAHNKTMLKRLEMNIRGIFLQRRGENVIYEIDNRRFFSHLTQPRDICELIIVFCSARHFFKSRQAHIYQLVRCQNILNLKWLMTIPVTITRKTSAQPHRLKLNAFTKIDVKRICTDDNQRTGRFRTVQNRSVKPGNRTPGCKPGCC